METGCSQRDREEALIAFVHIPKTAGTTLNSILARQYSPDELHEVMMRGMSWIAAQPRIVPKPLISFSKIQRLKSALNCPRRLRVIHGHFDLSIMKLLPPGARCFTLLRDPVERAISHYYHYRRMTGDPVHPLAMKSTLAQWVGACGLVEMDNGQTRRLAGGMNLPCGRVSSGTLERAKSNLARFAVVGLTERFEESLMLLQRAFNWTPQPFPPCNVGENRPRRHEVGEETLQEIRRCNQLDLELYRFASDLFERALRN
jgi:Sulfotransferase family